VFCTLKSFTITGMLPEWTAAKNMDTGICSFQHHSSLSFAQWTVMHSLPLLPGPRIDCPQINSAKRKIFFIFQKCIFTAKNDKLNINIAYYVN
jgi:hypothetical protein